MNDPTETIPGQLDEIKKRLDAGELRMNEADKARIAMSVKIDATVNKLDAHDLKLDTIISGLAENTAISNTVKDALTTARVGRTVLIWAAGIAGAAVSLWTAVQALGHH